MKKITKRQFEIAGFIRDFIGKNTISPTLYDIAEYFSIKPSTAAAHIAALERKRVIVRQKGRRRSIRPVGMGSGLPQKVPVCVPFFQKNINFAGAPARIAREPCIERVPSRRGASVDNGRQLEPAPSRGAWRELRRDRSRGQYSEGRPRCGDSP